MRRAQRERTNSSNQQVIEFQITDASSGQLRFRADSITPVFPGDELRADDKFKALLVEVSESRPARSTLASDLHAPLLAQQGVGASAPTTAAELRDTVNRSAPEQTTTIPNFWGRGCAVRTAGVLTYGTLAALMIGAGLIIGFGAYAWKNPGYKFPLLDRAFTGDKEAMGVTLGAGVGGLLAMLAVAFAFSKTYLPLFARTVPTPSGVFAAADVDGSGPRSRANSRV